MCIIMLRFDIFSTSILWSTVTYHEIIKLIATQTIIKSIHILFKYPDFVEDIFETFSKLIMLIYCEC